MRKVWVTHFGNSVQPPKTPPGVEHHVPGTARRIATLARVQPPKTPPGVEHGHVIPLCEAEERCLHVQPPKTPPGVEHLRGSRHLYKRFAI